MDGVVKNSERRHCRKCFASSKRNSQGVIQQDLECLNNNSIAKVIPIHMIQLRIFHASSTKWWKKEHSKLKLLGSQSEKHMKNKESIDKNSSKIIVIKKMKIYRNRSKKGLGKWLRDSNKMLRVWSKQETTWNRTLVLSVSLRSPYGMISKTPKRSDLEMNQLFILMEYLI